MAASHAQNGQVKTFYNTVDLDSFLCVGRATGIKAAVITHERAQAGFVAGDNENEQTTH
jgi:formylmethanofuran dehydrogenase subunit E